MNWFPRTAHEYFATLITGAATATWLVMFFSR